jgi:hypothetical protein
MAETIERRPQGFSFYLAAEATSTLFAASAFLAVVTFWQRGENDLGYYAVALSIPALASMLLLGLGSVVTGIFATGRLGFPLNFTLPLIHGSLMAASVELIRTGLGLIRLPGPLEATMLWANPRMIVVSVVAQFIVISVLSVMRPSGPPLANREPGA